mgnify:CR=1 FL=1
MTNTKDYHLAVKEAAKKLGKSVTTVHRYVNKGKLSGKYVDTEHGKEVRLKNSEVEELAEKLNEKPEKLPEGADLPPNSYEGEVNTLKLLERYEKTLYQLGQLTEKLEQKKKAKQDKINRLEEQSQRLRSQLHDKAALIEALQNELNRPLNLWERLKGRRITNH